MNNYEHITRGGIDTLIDFETNRPVFGAIGEYRDWLEAEYIEPDTQERINEDAGKGPCEYFGHDDMSCSEGGECRAASSHDSCYTCQRLDLLRRQRKLDGVSE